MSDRREERPTTVLDPRTITGPSWPIVLATLEQIAPWAPLAMRLGILTLLQHNTRAMAEPDAGAELVNEAQALLDALRHMPWEGK